MQRHISIDGRFHGRVTRVGMKDNILYLQPSIENAIEIWSLDSFYPSSWRQIFSLHVYRVVYAVSCCSTEKPFIYVFYGGIENENIDLFEFAIFEINTITLEYNKYLFQPSQSTLSLIELPLESLALGCSDRVYLYDSSIVMGPIPYWYVEFKEETFSLVQKNINDVDEAHSGRCTRFPIPFDGANRVFGRLKDDGSLIVYDGKEEKWSEYQMSLNSCLFQLPSSTARGIRETFGRSGHRVGAVETYLTFHAEAGCCIAKIIRNEKHYFYEIVLDHDLKTYLVLPRGSAALHSDVDKMFYPMSDRRNFIFVGIRSIAVVALQPPSLQDMALWQVQQYFCGETGNRQLKNGLSAENVKELCKQMYLMSVLAKS